MNRADHICWQSDQHLSNRTVQWCLAKLSPLLPKTNGILWRLFERVSWFLWNLMFPQYSQLMINQKCIMWLIKLSVQPKPWLLQVTFLYKLPFVLRQWSFYHYSLVERDFYALPSFYPSLFMREILFYLIIFYPEFKWYIFVYLQYCMSILYVCCLSFELNGYIYTWI